MTRVKIRLNLLLTIVQPVNSQNISSHFKTLRRTRNDLVPIAVTGPINHNHHRGARKQQKWNRPAARYRRGFARRGGSRARRIRCPYAQRANRRRGARLVAHGSRVSNVARDRRARSGAFGPARRETSSGAVHGGRGHFLRKPLCARAWRTQVVGRCDAAGRIGIDLRVGRAGVARQARQSRQSWVT